MIRVVARECKEKNNPYDVSASGFSLPLGFKTDLNAQRHQGYNVAVIANIVRRTSLYVQSVTWV